jgi:hypothetical protein
MDGPGQPMAMTCLADASFLGVVVDDLRQRASESYRLRLAAAPPAGLQYSCVPPA